MAWLPPLSVLAGLFRLLPRCRPDQAAPVRAVSVQEDGRTTVNALGAGDVIAVR